MRRVVNDKGALQYLKMKSNKGIISILANLAEFILQNRLDVRQASTQHLQALEQEIALSKSQLFPSTEILHFLIDRPSYQVKSRLLNKLKTLDLEELTLEISFTVSDKITSVTHLGELWKMAVKKEKEENVNADSIAHQLLFLLQNVLTQLKPGEFFSDLSRNEEGTRKLIIDFQISIAGESNHKNQDLSTFGKMWTNQARLDSSRSLVLECFSNTFLPTLVPQLKKCPYLFSGEKVKVKSPSTKTRGDSMQFDNSERETRRHRSSEQTLFEIYDSELDLTIISSDSDDASPSQTIAEVNFQEEEIQEFELLIEESNKDTDFMRENEALFGQWEKGLTNIFS